MITPPALSSVVSQAHRSGKCMPSVFRMNESNKNQTDIRKEFRQSAESFAIMLTKRFKLRRISLK